MVTREPSLDLRLSSGKCPQDSLTFGYENVFQYGHRYEGGEGLVNDDTHWKLSIDVL